MRGGFSHRLRTDDGQMVLTALLGLLPLIVLVLSLINTQIVTQDKVRRQTAADAAVLSGAALEARAMNLISTGNVAMTYLLAEAMASEALLRALDEAIRVCDVTIASLESGCSFGSIFGFSGACDLIPIYEGQRSVLAETRSVVTPVLGSICAKPGERGMPAGGALFAAMKTLEEMEASVSVTALPTQGAADAVARANGADGALLAPLHAVLPVVAGRFWNLAEPTRYGSRSPEHGGSPPFQRGYHPILGLRCDHGPLHSCADRYRLIMLMGSLVGGPAIYDDALDRVYSDWMRVPPVPARAGRAILDYDRARSHAASIVVSSYLNAHITTHPMADASAPPLESLIADDTRFRNVGGGAGTASATCEITGASDLVDPMRSGGTRTIRFDWYDPAADAELGSLTRIRPGLWLVGEPRREPAGDEGAGLHRYVYEVVCFQLAFETEGPSPLERDIDLEEDVSWSAAMDAEVLPRPYLLDGVRKIDDIRGFRSRTFTLGVAWGTPAQLFAPSLFRPSPTTQYACAQAEMYNGTSWDLFTQDWRVRLVPVSLLERGEDGVDPGLGGLPAPIQAMGSMSRSVARWFNTR